MAEILYDEVPSLNLADFTSGSEVEKQEFVRKLGAAYTNIGFVSIKNHGLSDKLVKNLYSSIEAFFKLPDETKRKYEKVKLFGQRGYISKGKEKAKGRNTGDLKEFYHFYLWGRFPSNMSSKTRSLCEQLTDLSAVLLQWIEDNTPSNVRQLFSMPLSKMIDNSDYNLLRVIHYPPLKGKIKIPTGSIRAAAHEDINLITVLPAATQSGLQVKDLEENWHDVPCEDDTIAINVGDMLQMTSEGYYPSTTHRVINPNGTKASEARLSMPLFLHPRSEVRLSLAHTAGSYLKERLREIGLKK